MRIASVAQPVPLHRVFDYEVPPPLASAALPGARVRAPFGSRRLTGVILSVKDGAPERVLKSIDSVLDEEPLLDQGLLDLSGWMARRYLAPPGECLKALLPAFIRRRADARKAGPASGAREPADLALTPGQAAALAGLEPRLDGRLFSACVLFGVPASGKTEVYLRLMRRAVEQGGQALYLLPEISLTHPFFDELSRRAGFSVARWHSRLGAGERNSVWMGLREGRIKAVVGARSASLLPFKDLRLVVMDEEQDESYKQEGQPPFYHARDVALERARRSGALVVLGSATPSVETVAAAESGRFSLIRLAERAGSSVPPPRTEIVDSPGRRGLCLSDVLLGKMEDRMARGEQVILLVNRRGFSNLAVCRKCGWTCRCPSCGIALVHHQEAGGGFAMRCHHCGRRLKVPEACGDCGGVLSFSGVGTQRVVSELKSRLPKARVLRLDRDTATKRAGDDFRIYDAFRRGEADVLVGTKLVAKGFHFPNVTLVGVVDADTMLNMPDFRSSEKTVQLLLQAAGRSGRAEKPGEVVIQTLRPDHYALQAAARGDYLRYAGQEMRHRLEMGYPPSAGLVRLVFSGRKEKAAADAAEAAAAFLRGRFQPPRGDVLGPSPAVRARLRGRFRWHVLVKLFGETGFDPALAGEVRSLTGAEPRLQIVVDPYDLF